MFDEEFLKKLQESNSARNKKSEATKQEIYKMQNKPFQGQQQHKTRQDEQQFKRQDDRGDAKRYRGWNSIIRISGFLAAIVGMYISAQFSVDGFSIQVPDRTWVGWGLVIILIVIQSAWQRFGDNLTIFALAMICYVYGITTNVIGIMGNRGGAQDFWDYLIPVIFGILLEVFPEPFLAWSISGDTSSDPLKKFVERWS